MNTFNEALNDWQLFYATVATASATLSGLLFVALSINFERLRGSTGANRLRISRRTFFDFIYVLMIGLVFLVPRQTPAGFSLALLVLAVSRLASLIRQSGSDMRVAQQKQTILEVVREYALPVVAALGLVLVAVAVLAGRFDALYWLVAAIAALLTRASWNAWLLLVQEGEAS